MRDNQGPTSAVLGVHHFSEARNARLDNPLCEIAMTKIGPAAVFPSKLGAAAQLAKLTGWNSAEKVSVEGIPAGVGVEVFVASLVSSFCS